MKKRIYIAGCGGMLGAAFYEQFNTDFDIKCSDIDVNAPWLSYLDFRDYNAYKKDVTDFKPDYLFHLGAYTDLEYCEHHEEDTYMTNTLSVEHAVYIANQLKIPLLYISTAGIFDGNKEVYDDWDQPNPSCVYARSKYMGERFVIENTERYLVCRAGWMMGGGPEKDKKFIQKILKQIRNGKKELFVVDDKDGTPTYTRDFAGNVRLLLESELWGLYNMVSEGLTSRLEVARFLVEAIGKKEEIKISPVTSEYFQAEYFARRPDSERLINKKLNIRKMNIMRDWKTALVDYLEKDYKDYLL